MKSPCYQLYQRCDQWWVCGFDEDSDCSLPKTSYPTKELAVARLMQLLEITTTIEPQMYPEKVCIGDVNV